MVQSFPFTPSLPSHLLFFLPFPSLTPFLHLPPLNLEVGPLKSSYRVWGHCKLAQRDLVKSNLVHFSLKIRWIFSGGRRNFCSLWRAGHFGHSRSPKVTELVPIESACDFLLVRNSNFGPILHRFRDMTAFMCSWPHPYSTLILGVFPLYQVANVGCQRPHGP